MTKGEIQSKMVKLNRRIQQLLDMYNEDSIPIRIVLEFQSIQKEAAELSQGLREFLILEGEKDAN
jgi:hypothetical protein